MLTSASMRRVPTEGIWIVESVRTFPSVTTGTYPTDKSFTLSVLALSVFPTTTFPAVVRDVPVFARSILADVVAFRPVMSSKERPVSEPPSPMYVSAEMFFVVKRDVVPASVMNSLSPSENLYARGFVLFNAILSVSNVVDFIWPDTCT